MEKVNSPFKFLDAYTEEDYDLFYGRDIEAKEIFNKLFSGNMLLVFGRSGVGKTSLVQCGLNKEFRKSEVDWLPIYIRRGDNILSSLHSTLINKFKYLKGNNDLSEFILSISMHEFKPIYFVFDQFEELFILGDLEERKKFAVFLNSILNSDCLCKFIFIIREEYLANLTEFEKYIPSILENRIRIENISRNNAIDAIVKPCEFKKIVFENEFPKYFLDKYFSDSSSIDPTNFQLYIDRLFKKAIYENPKNPILNQLLLDKYGKISDIISDFLDEQLKKFSEPDKVIFILKAFVSSEGTKKPNNIRFLQEYFKNSGRGNFIKEIEGILNDLVNMRILHDKNQYEQYELRHDILAKNIFNKISPEEKEINEVRQYTQNAYYEYKKRGIFLSKENLDYILPFQDKLYLNKEQKEFIKKSNILRKKERTRNKTIILLSIFTALLFLSYLLIYLIITSVNKNEIENLKNKLEYAIFKNQASAPEAGVESLVTKIYIKADKNGVFNSDSLPLIYLRFKGINDPEKVNSIEPIEIRKIYTKGKKSFHLWSDSLIKIRLKHADLEYNSSSPNILVDIYKKEMINSSVRIPVRLLFQKTGYYAIVFRSRIQKVIFSPNYNNPDSIQIDNYPKISWNSIKSKQSIEKINNICNNPIDTIYFAIINVPKAVSQTSPGIVFPEIKLYPN